MFQLSKGEKKLSKAEVAGKHLGLRFAYELMDAKPCLSLRHICIALLKMW